MNKKSGHFLEEWGLERPFIIAGPCSAESEQQLFSISRVLAENNIILVRAGLWKPRSRPNNFEGVGVQAFEWIKNIKSEIKIRFMIEVGNPKHVELALKNEIDALWIGARTTVNPFSVQEIADALEGVDIPVFVKNPINPDLALWIGALERIMQTGNQKVVAVHRGFSFFRESPFRNLPAWQIPLQLKSSMPAMTLICDPSHIAGNRTMIQEISQKAIDLNYDGLMIETHIEPEQALSDPDQQVTPAELFQILDQLNLRDESSSNQLFNNQLEELREKIDHLDREILEAIATRMKLVDEIGEYKKDNNVTVFQLERWKEILETRPHWGSSLLLNKQFVEEVYKVIHDESIRVQTEIMKKAPADLD